MISLLLWLLFIYFIKYFQMMEEFKQQLEDAKAARTIQNERICKLEEYECASCSRKHNRKDPCYTPECIKLAKNEGLAAGQTALNERFRELFR